WQPSKRASACRPERWATPRPIPPPPPPKRPSGRPQATTRRSTTGAAPRKPPMPDSVWLPLLTEHGPWALMVFYLLWRDQQKEAATRDVLNHNSVVLA